MSCRSQNTRFSTSICDKAQVTYRQDCGIPQGMTSARNIENVVNPPGGANPEIATPGSACPSSARTSKEGASHGIPGGFPGIRRIAFLDQRHLIHCAALHSVSSCRLPGGGQGENQLLIQGRVFSNHDPDGPPGQAALVSANAFQRWTFIPNTTSHNANNNSDAPGMRMYGRRCAAKAGERKYAKLLNR